MKSQAQNPPATLVDANDAKAKLLRSALSLFSEKGYDGTTIREIIQRASVTRPVLYYYFKNKEDLFRRLVEANFDEFIAGVDEIRTKCASCRDRLKALARMAFERAERSPDIVRLILHVFFAPPGEGPELDVEELGFRRLQGLACIMGDGIESGELGAGDAWSLAVAFSGIIDMCIMAKSHQRDSRLTPELADGLVDLFLQGAATGRVHIEFPFRVNSKQP